MVFQEQAIHGPELDPEILIAANRMDALRRAWHKMPYMQQTLTDSWLHYQRADNFFV